MRAILTQEVGEAPADPTNVALTGRVLGWVGFQGDMILTNDDIESSFDEEGWTELAYTPGSNATVVYVSSSTGSDTNSGLATNLAKATWSSAMNIPGNGATNIYFLGRRGDVWSSTTISLPGTFWGISDTQPVVFGAFGPVTDPRPRIEPNLGNSAISAFAVGSNTPTENMDFIWFTHMELKGHYSNHFDASMMGGQSGLDIFWHSGADCEGMLIEGMDIYDFSTGIGHVPGKDAVTPNRAYNNLTIRRCAIHNNHRQTGDNHGAFIGNHTGSGGYHSNVVIDQCLLFMNGWGTNYVRDTTGRDQGIYVTDENRNFTYKNCQNFESAGTGIQMRPGGICSNNFFQEFTTALTIGLVRGGSDPVPGGVERTDVHGCVFLNGFDLPGGNPRGKSCIIANSQQGTVYNNLSAHYIGSVWNAAKALVLNGDIDGATEPDIGVHNITLTSNFTFAVPPLQLTDWSESGMRMSNILVQRNHFYHTTNSFDAPMADELWVVRTEEDIGGSSQATNIRFSSNVYYSVNPASQAFEYNNTLVSYAVWGAATNANDSNSTLTNAVPSFTDTARYAQTYFDQVMGTSGSTLTNYANWWASNMRLGTWNTNFRTIHLINYVREGFDLDPIDTNGLG